MRVTLDNNIVVRATPGRTNAAREVLQLLTQSPHQLITASILLTELDRVLKYPRVRLVHGLDDSGIQSHVQFMTASSISLNPLTPAPIQTRDPDDDLVIATAIAGQAEVICTRDQHFYDAAVQSACAAHGIRIINEIDLLKELRSLSSPTSGTP